MTERVLIAENPAHDARQASLVRWAAIAGYSLFLAMTASFLWGGYVSVFSGALAFPNVALVDFIAKWTVFPLAMLGAGALTWLRPYWAQALSPAVPYVFLLGGGLLMLVAGNLRVHPQVSVVCISALYALGCALFFVLLQNLISAQSNYTAGLVVMIAAGISPLVHFGITLLPIPIVLYTELLAVGPICVVLLFYVRRHSDFGGAAFRSVPRKEPVAVRTAMAELWRPLFCIASVGFIVGFVRSLTSSNAQILNTFNMVSMIGLFLSSIVLLLLWHFMRFKFDLGMIYHISFPIAATGFVLLPFLSSMFVLAVAGLIFLLFSVVSALMVITCVQAARQRVLQPVLVYGIFAGLVYGASSIGAAVGMVSNSTGFGFTQMLILTLMLFYLVSVILFIPSRRKPTDETPGSPDLQGSRDTPDTRNTQESHDSRDTRDTRGAAGLDIVAVRCQRLREQYRLSTRETEIAILIARGRDVPTIARILFISANTVRTHSKSLFRKLNVHNKQELLDLVEREE